VVSDEKLASERRCRKIFHESTVAMRLNGGLFASDFALAVVNPEGWQYRRVAAHGSFGGNARRGFHDSSRQWRARESSAPD